MSALDDGNDRGSVKDLKVHNVELLPEAEAKDYSITRRSDSSSSSSSHSSLESDKDDSKSKHTINEFPESSPYSTDFGFPSSVWSFQGETSVTESPPSQTMARPPGYDPNRIPLSIFSSKPTTPNNPTSWIHPSQESLFSLQMGNNSFSRDHFLASSNCEESARPCVDIDQKQSDSALLATDASEQAAEFVVVAPAVRCESIDRNVLVVESEKVVLCEAQEDSSKEAKNIPSLSCHSGESLASDQSFQFPVLGGDSERRHSLTKESEKGEVEKPIRPPSPKTETETNPSPVNRWYHFSCC